MGSSIAVAPTLTLRHASASWPVLKEWRITTRSLGQLLRFSFSRRPIYSTRFLASLEVAAKDRAGFLVAAVPCISPSAICRSPELVSPSDRNAFLAVP